MKTFMHPSAHDLDEALATTLLANLGAFQAFAQSRLRDEHLAADAVQESLLRALQAGHRLTSDQNLVAWFYRILRNVMTDLHRRRTSRSNALERFASEMEHQHAANDGLERVACHCIAGLLPTLNPDYARVLQLADLDGQPPEVAAREIGITRGNFKVRLHRARRQLRERLEQTCRACATHGCLNCTCNS
jgi:RNA polymerase sigma-70 factor (ECF subfamily)